MGCNHALPGLFITSPALSRAGFGPYIAQSVSTCLILKIPRLGNNVPLAASPRVEARLLPKCVGMQKHRAKSQSGSSSPLPGDAPWGKRGCLHSSPDIPEQDDLSQADSRPTYARPRAEGSSSLLARVPTTLLEIAGLSCLETQLGNKKKNICPDGLGQGATAGLLPTPILRCEGCSVPHHRRRTSPGEPCWWCWAGDSLCCLTTRSRWGVSRPSLVCK